jgi:alkylhydroperoxidase family enzyme
VRFDSARAAGLDETRAALVADNYAQTLAPHEIAALALTDALVGIPQALNDELKAQLSLHYTQAQRVELGLGVGLFLGMSKVLIALGCEPEEMPVTVVPTPGSKA